MPRIRVGEKLPSAMLYEGLPENPRNILEVAGNKRAVIFGVPGAYVPGCSKVHLRGFVDKSDVLRSLGYEEIICVAVNDPFVLSSWGNGKGARDKVRMLADPEGSYTRAIGMDVDMPELGGTRSRRYSMATVNGIVKELFMDTSTEPMCLQRAEALPNFCA